nr:protein seele isoform X2 [Ipomoea batatas]GMD56056.1 protein seele isoform X2 [Ipomoea batatas]
MAKASLISLAILLVSVVPFVYSIEDKCGACTAVAEELEHGLMTEKPRNHLDMRHRLDSKGQREGKLIDYRVSDLRVVELLDELCEKMQDYTLEKYFDSRNISSSFFNLSFPLTDKQEARAHSKAISSFCGR